LYFSTDGCINKSLTYLLTYVTVHCNCLSRAVTHVRSHSYLYAFCYYFH